MNTLSINQVLDVTLRDGGYLNNWAFDKDEIIATLRFLSSLGIRMVELGFLKGPCQETSLVYGCKPAFLSEIKALFPDISLVAILKGQEEDWRGALKGRLPYLSVLRMPCTESQIDKMLSIAEVVKAKAPQITISINLICIAKYSESDLRSAISTINHCTTVDLLYFADSYGALVEEEVTDIFTLAHEHWDRDLGFHAHDTLGNALANSDAAICAGCNWIDASMNGFGLGGGNMSLGRLLDHYDLGPLAPQANEAVTKFCADHCSLRHPDADTSNWYSRFARKGIDTMWINKLKMRYADNLASLIDKIPRKQYKTIDAVIEEIGQ